MSAAGLDFTVPAAPLAATAPGSAVSLYLRPAAGRLMLRVPGHAALARWPVGAPITVGFDGAEPVAFPD